MYIYIYTYSVNNGSNTRCTTLTSILANTLSIYLLQNSSVKASF